MKSLKLGAIVLGSIGLIFVGACSNQSANSEDSAANQTETVAEKGHSENDGHDHSEDEKEGEHSHGGQVIESGEYHLELVAEPNDEGIHLDFYLEKGEKHEKISDAKVTAQVQLPGGEQKSIPLEYEADEKHYHAILPQQAAGEYKVTILSEINGEKINSRFSVKR